MDHGTLRHFRDILHRVAVGKDIKKDVNACIDFLLTVLKGHFVASACEVLGIKEPTDHPTSEILPPILERTTHATYLDKLGEKVLMKCGIQSASFDGEKHPDSKDSVYNYTRVLCHYTSLIMEFLDGWSEGDGDRVYRSDSDTYCKTNN